VQILALKAIHCIGAFLCWEAQGLAGFIFTKRLVPKGNRQ
jgi:hypothetical protein